MIAIASDHAGFELKEILKKYLTSLSYEVKDFGTHSSASVDYPDFAHPLASSVEQGECEFGVLVCGSGQGVCITANKHQNIRAALVWQVEIAELARAHNDANVICLPARFLSEEDAKNCVSQFLKTTFEGGRHANRVNKIPC